MVVPLPFPVDYHLSGLTARFHFYFLTRGSFRPPRVHASLHPSADYRTHFVSKLVGDVIGPGVATLLLIATFAVHASS
jgi:hypothetical protein